MQHPATKQELKETTVMTIPIDAASSMIHSGPPGDEEENYAPPDHFLDYRLG